MPAFIWNFPPFIVTVSLVWMLSSAESIVIFPPSTVKAVPALSALALPVSLLDELLVFEGFAHGPIWKLSAWVATLLRPPPETILISPSEIVSVVSAWIPSPPEVIFKLPPSIIIYPLVVSSVLSDLTPSPVEFTVISPPFIVIESLPFNPLFTAVTFTVPAVIFKSSLLAIPLL